MDSLIGRALSPSPLGGVALKAVVLGCGLMGSVVARDLSRSVSVNEIAVFDTSLANLRRIEGVPKVRPVVGDVCNADFIMQRVKEFDVAIGALPFSIDEKAVEAVARAGVSVVDLIDGLTHGRSEIDSIARKNGITILPACGVAPGLTNILTMHAVDSLDKTNEVHIKVGGLPQKREPPLNYRVTWSLEDVIEMYTRPARIVQNGELTEVEALTGLEKVTFPPPIGECEAFYTDGLSTLPSTIRNVDYMDEKTIRYPGHADEIRTLIQCGLLDPKPIEFAGVQVSPREFTTKVLASRLTAGDGKDLTLLRIDVKGSKEDHQVIHTFEMIDYYDEREKTTSMARTTAFPASIAAQMVANGEVGEKGIVPCELAFRGDRFTKFMKELNARGINIRARRDEMRDLSAD